MGSLARLKETPLAVAAAVAGFLCAGALIGCSGGGVPGGIPRPQSTPLAFMAGRQVVVLPVQRNISFPDSTWQQPPSVSSQFIAALDDSIASALGDRGLKSTWTFAREISAAARRNTGMLPDPHALAVAGLRRLVRASDDPLSDPLASQVRALVSMRDARYAILPATLVFEKAAGGLRGTVLVYLIDARTARIQWSGAVTGDASRSLSPAMAGDIAQRIADLVAAR
ncbi:MAG: hypothetical protein M3O61_15170 [Gemmatimonadota bacterium]|nr:hypothetical protein [Gemmatimonadota bacterium]